ncbi:LysR family transcriptional regulator [Salinarimonas soli]|uniref:LysR family transcriptional regulator n=1 Tax=Salinarimonas soli TaxID=1638099 RepID=A0A5B2VBR1_9HYPH|nr:LysR substrate-binding domain-containing protein [Salinarimonas soli]KAA2236394.1 LysR family transcriptional regulator [Salinarimonas soli]
MSRNLDTALLRAFVAVAETAGMTSAANVLNLTQAAVSQQIKRLEDQLGQPLFTRDRRGLSLTGAGERLFGKAKRLLALNDEIWSDMTSAVHEGQVRLGIPYDLVTAYLPPVLKTFARAYPRVRIALECRSSPRLREALAAGEIDLALATEREVGPDGEALVSDRLVWVGARGGEAHAQRPLPVSIGSESCAFRPSVLDALRAAAIEWRAVTEISNMDAINATVETDLAVMTLLASTVPATLEVLPPEAGLPALPVFSINLYRPRTGLTPVAAELARHIRDGFVCRHQRQAA